MFRALGAVSAAVVLLAINHVDAAEKPARGQAGHVVLVAWDGMRPDFISEELTPNLWRLAQRGTTFRRHHSVFPSLTTVNTAALATGVHPQRNGLLSNYEYRPAFEPKENIRTDSIANIFAGDAQSGGKFLKMPTVAALVQANTDRAVVAGTKSASVLHSRNPTPDSKSVTLAAGETFPPGASAEIVKLLGAYPKKSYPNAAQDTWTTRALTEVLWKEGLPAFSVLWLSEPDYSQHETGIGSPESIAGIRASDANLGLVLSALEAKKALATTDVLVVSDHGFSTVARQVNTVELAREAGFDLMPPGAPGLGKGELRVVGNGGTVLFYVGDQEEKTISRVVEWLQRSDFAGVIFARGEHEGTFPLAQAQLETADGPDVVVSMRWSDAPNEFGIRGSVVSHRTKDPVKGTHGTLSAFDVHNTLVAAGPDFPRGEVDVPTSNLDVAATIAHILAIQPAEPLDGRPLNLPFPGEAVVRTLEASRKFPDGEWRQYLRISEVRATRYLDEGNGEFRPARD
jgi:arylsulfatase A-like enzyme